MVKPSHPESIRVVDGDRISKLNDLSWSAELASIDLMAAARLEIPTVKVPWDTLRFDQETNDSCGGYRYWNLKLVVTILDVYALVSIDIVVSNHLALWRVMNQHCDVEEVEDVDVLDHAVVVQVHFLFAALDVAEWDRRAILRLAIDYCRAWKVV